MVSDCCWRVAPERVTASKHEIHLWRASFRQHQSMVEALRDTLSDDERERADRYRVDTAYQAFIVGRGLLRMILARYLPVNVRDIRIAYNTSGKPFVASEDSLREGENPSLDFNLSHSGDLLVFAVALERSVGIDIEKLRPVPDAERLVNRFFSPAEKASYAAIPKESRNMAFFQYWTLKEAYVKARGRGLSLPLHSFEVSLSGDGMPRLVQDEELGTAASNWSLSTLHVGRGYVAALATEGHGCRLACWQWDP